ncbi:MAG: peptidylprolyl isomerase, partial [Candidatus Firestonebacteria bacterium]|nr:peptidylprolyl isomerase [Candidatus Firestonebacteria bacterium]
ADEIKKLIENGANFALIAREKSIDTESKSTGGDMGYIKLGKYNATFNSTIVALPLGSFSSIIKTPQGFHIIQKMDERLTIAEEKK